MKIAIIGQKGIPSKFGGIEKHVEELSTRLAALGHDVTVYTRPWYTPKSKKEFKGVKLVSLPSVRTKHLDAISHTFVATIHAILGKYDIIHYNAVGPSLLAFIPRIFSKAKVVITFHCLDRMLNKWGFFAKMVLYIGEYASNKFAHVTIAVSKELYKYCEENFHNDNLEYIPNGISQPIYEDADDIKKLFNLEKNGYILVTARLIESKGIHYLIEAYKQLNTNKKLVIAGDSAFTDDYVRYLHELAGNDPNIVFCGFQSGKILHELYTNCHLYVFPSVSEGLSISLLEAMSYGKCVLASNIPANIEAMGEFGKTFNNRDVVSLKNKLSYLLKNPLIVRELGKSAQNHVLKNYNWDNIVHEVSDAYREVKYRNAVNIKEKSTGTAIEKSVN